MGRVRTFFAVVAVCGLVGVGAQAVPAGGAVVLAGDRSIAPGSTVAGADTGMVSTGTGPVSIFGGSDIRVMFPPGTAIAHADSRFGVPNSPIQNRPTEGDVVGTYVLTSAFNYSGCGAPVNRAYRFVWNEAFWNGPTDSRKVAELGLQFETSPGVWFDYSSFGVHFDILRTGSVGGLSTYEAVMPTSATVGFFCDGAYYRQTAHFLAPFGKALMRNPETPGTYAYCTRWTTNAGEQLEFCNDVTIDAPDGASSAGVTSVECTLTGTEGPDVIRGTSGDDVICGLGGDDRIIAGDGVDVVLGGDGADRIAGGDGDDTIDAGAGADIVNAGTGDDVVFGGDDADRLVGGSGDDAVNGGTGDDVVNGGVGNDSLDGGPDADRLVLGPGDDRAYGGAGDDVAAGGAGNDMIAGGDGVDALAGSVGSDLVYGGPAPDSCRPEDIIDLGIVVDC